MPRGKPTTTTTTSTTTSSTRARVATQERSGETLRIQSMEPHEGRVLSSLEEAVVRMHHGVSLKAASPLPTNGVSDEAMAQMLEMELRAFELTGRGEELDDIPVDAMRAAGNERTRRIVAELAKKQ